MVSDLPKNLTPASSNLLKVGDTLDSLWKNPQNSVIHHKLSESLLPSPLKTIYITGEALEKCYLMAEEVKNMFKTPMEAYALLLGHSTIVEDIIFPHQIVSYTSVYISPEAILQLKDFIQNESRSILGWVHSHADFGVFFSGTDYQNQKILLAETANYLAIQETQIKFCYGMTVNIQRDHFGIVTTQFTSGDVQNEIASFEIHSDLSPSWNSQEEKKKIFSLLEGKIQMNSTRFFPLFKHDAQNNEKSV